ncbi:DUF937 domain-containing protein [Microvirga terricola]|uniref:DUF937 domain-containing protein n=1 Tax=Microvirga terricola TaxID=2719797 RepID=A0ABX0VB04_9HYPH|nr:DUF937 domain-containing protein [Microvirga terricola]NIX76683.1 DUF937 domain-containing protein [Microvirga terricola]
MFNWFDLMQQAQESAGFGTLRRQFNLSDDQSRKAMAAFLPAFALGLQRSTDPNDPSRALQSMISDASRTFWQAAGQSFSTQAQREGRKLLDQLFGSDETSLRIAHQTADFVGLSIDLMQQMMPIMAGIMAGSMYQWMSAQARALQGAAGDAKAAHKEDANAPWVEFWDAWLNAMSPKEKPAQNPFEEATAAFFRPFGFAKPEQKNTAQPWAAWGEMMAAGQEMQQQYLTSLQSIFGEAGKTGKAKR